MCVRPPPCVFLDSRLCHTHTHTHTHTHSLTHPHVNIYIFIYTHALSPTARATLGPDPTVCLLFPSRSVRFFFLFEGHQPSVLSAAQFFFVHALSPWLPNPHHRKGAEVRSLLYCASILFVLFFLFPLFGLFRRLFNPSLSLSLRFLSIEQLQVLGLQPRQKMKKWMFLMGGMYRDKLPCDWKFVRDIHEGALCCGENGYGRGR